MPLETWLIKVKKTISHSFDSVRVTPPPPLKSPAVKRSRIGVLAFEVAGIMPKLTHMWQFLSDENIAQIHNHSVCTEGVRKIVSTKDDFLISLACAETVESLRILANSVSRLSKRCEESTLRCFESVFDVFANTGHDPYGWVLPVKEMEIRVKKMERYVMATSTLYKEMDELTVLENKLKKSLDSSKSKGQVRDQDRDQYPDPDHEDFIVKNATQQKILDLQQKIMWQKQQVKYVKEKSLWNRSFDSITSLLATSIFTILSRIKIVFGFGFGITNGHQPTALPRSLSASAAVYPSDNHQPSDSWNLDQSKPLIKSSKHQENNEISHGFFETNSKIIKPSPSTLGFAGLSLHYANLIIVMEKMIRLPQLVGLDARDDLYSMLPNSIRLSLRGRLKGIGFSASDPILAAEWREALGKILGWLSPLAHNMIKWQSERSFEHQNRVTKTNVLLLQTLFFANREKTEAAITELLVGLNYIWRFEREMNAKALFNCIIPVKCN